MRAEIDIPSLPGAYLLVIDLGRPLTFTIAGKRTVTLPPGRYAYCGSARGPGGLAARLARHLRSGKSAHWHVDRLTRAGRVVAIGLCPHGRECALFDAVSQLPGVSIPAPGLGSSDCDRCAAHLAAVGPAFLPRTIGLPDALAA